MKLEVVKDWMGRNTRRLLVAGVGVVLVGVGVFWLKTQDEGEGVKVLSAQENVLENGEQNNVFIVDVEGGVSRPGVYKVNIDKRVNDVLEMAGGLTSDADNRWVELNLNRSAKLTDGMKIYVPRVLEKKGETSGSLEMGKLDINTVSESELDTLPGVGPATAAKIISGRPYAAASELVDKKIVTQKVWEQIKDQVSTW